VDDIDMSGALQRINEMVRIGRLSSITHQIVTVNVDFIVNALADPEARFILQDASLSTADGMPVVWAARFLGVNLPERVAGADLVPLLIAQAARNGHSLFLLGGAPGIAAQAAAILQNQYPGLLVAGVLSPPFTSILEMDDNIVETIKVADPDILLVAFGNPKQEKWIAMHRHDLGVPVAMGVGGSLDFITGYTRRAPRWMQQAGLEWLHRMLHQPRRLVRRYVKDFLVFGACFLWQWWVMQHRARLSTSLSLAEPSMIGRCGLLRIKGKLTNANLESFENQVWVLLDQTPHVILDFESAEFLDSRAIGSLVFFTQLARQRGGALYLTALPEKIARFLRFLQLNQYLTVLENVTPLLRGENLPAGIPPQRNDFNEIVTSDGKIWRVVYTPARFDGVTADEVRKQGSAALQRLPNLILDFSDSVFLNSAGLAVLKSLHEQAAGAGGQLALVGCRDDPLKVIRLAHFDSFLKVNPTFRHQRFSAKKGAYPS
jgi:N-acetylglucosaminyldiphosphoundecaprenol N-acetyl-beta-D-mannosaminyltransferase